MMKKSLFLKIFVLTLLTMCSVISFGKTKVLSIYTNPLTKSYTSLGKGELLLSRRNEFDKEIKFVAEVDGVTVEHNYVEWNEFISSMNPIKTRTGFTIRPEKNKVYSFMGIIPEGMPQARLIISYKGKQKTVELDWALETKQKTMEPNWALETGDEGEELDHYDVYF